MRIIRNEVKDPKDFFRAYVADYFVGNIEPLVLKGFLSRETCNEVIAVNNDNPTRTTLAPVGGTDVTLTSYRNSQSILRADFSPLTGKFTPERMAPAINEHWGLSYEYVWIPELPKPLYTTFSEGEYCRYHLDVIFDGDRMVRPTRRLSCVGYLNDWSPEPGPGVFTGGELCFPSIFDEDRGQCYVYRPCAGDVILFPSNPHYVHAVNEITSGVRHNIVSWLGFKV